ncbi:Cell cycle checkpoint protein RAD17 [Orchesella cincta]|uniref:Cell cycle checkpoint protein RAD17 n=1 Tax=Orchesella cincta TaxID=48709 RepID=A0A1D2MRQ7_ORCCI|nr:Cell cycle checkpoint protein RAD17 [Orchesella cincta]
MSQERRRSLRSHKSPSRIPVPSSASSQRKRPVAMLATEESAPVPVSNLRQSKLTGFRRLEALAKAEVKNRAQEQGQSNAGAVASKNFTPWVEKHLPRSVDDLFVHKKKVEEVTNWMSSFLQSPTASKQKICVVTGPSGVGKTATVCLVAQGLDAEVKEWINPMSLTQFRPGQDFREEVQGRNQTDLFMDFLFRTSQYRSLPIKGKTVKKYRLTLVEDIPNALFREPNTFQEILRKYAKTGISPLVFVFTDTASGEHSMFKMFPRTLMAELNILNISFNPVASSYMVKFMLDICTKESMPVDKGLVEDLAATANGDIRCAVNNLQFALTKERSAATSSGATFRKPAVSKRAKKQAPGNPAVAEVQQKDDTIQLFRALGKVLYAKRDESAISECEMQLVGEMEKERRVHPLIENPENICERAEVSTDTFLGFLHQNYPAFYGSLDDMQNAAEYLSIADYMVTAWKFDDSGVRAYKVREAKEQLGMSVAVRGLMHSNNNRVSVGWKPLTKPLVSNMENTIRESTESTRQGLLHLRELQTTLFTEAIPFYAKMIQTGKSCAELGPGVKNDILQKGLFKEKITRAVPLDEKETVEEGSEEPSEEDDPSNAQTGSSENLGKPVELNEKNVAKDLNGNLDDAGPDEDLFIEEYDD